MNASWRTEQSIRDLKAEVKKVGREKKGLLIELRHQLKIKDPAEKKTQDKEKEGQEKESKEEDKPVAEKKKGKKRGAPIGHKGKSRSVPSKVDATDVVHAPDQCDCGCCNILELEESDDKYIEDILAVVKTVTKVRYLRGKCTECGKIIRSKDALHGPPVIIGPNMASLLTMLRQKGMTFGNLSSLSTDMFDIPITRSGVLGIINRSVDKMEPAYDVIEYQVPKEMVLHGDETGWKIRRDAGYIWIFCNKNLVYFHHEKSRAGQVVKDILGEDYNGTCVCDFYGAYNVLKNTQRCLVHFLKDIKKQCEIYKGSKHLRTFKERFKDFIKCGVEVQAMTNSNKKDKKVKLLSDELDSIAEIKLPKGEPQNLRKRIINFKKQMLLFVSNPEVEYHNNRAERHLRPMVISRKNSFGSDTEEGAKRMCILHSVIETCKLHNIQPFYFIQKIIKEDLNIHKTISIPLLHI